MVGLRKNSCRSPRRRANISACALRENASGFTFVEVSLFIAISTLMLVSFLATVATRVATQRYRDTTNSFADFLRGVYSEVINVQNTRSGLIESQNEYCTLAGQAASVGTALAPNVNPNESYPGRSGCAIHGKLISFGEDEKEGTVYVYDVIGRATDFNNPLTGAGSTIEELASVYADVLSFDPESDTSSFYSLTAAKGASAYHLSWGAWPEDVDGNMFKGTVLIVRAPSSGAVRTFFLNRTLPIQESLSDPGLKKLGGTPTVIQSVANTVKNRHAEVAEFMQPVSDSVPSDQGFALTDINFCINSADIFAIKSHRNNVRIKADGHNGTAVEFVETDTGGNKCAHE